MEAKTQKLLDELRRTGTLDQWRAQIIEAFLASSAAAELKRKTREYVAASKDLSPIYLQKPDIAKRQLFSMLMNSTRQSSGIVQELESSLKTMIDERLEEIPPTWREQIQKVLDKIENPEAVADEMAPPSKRQKVQEKSTTTQDQGASEQVAKNIFKRILSAPVRSTQVTPPSASPVPGGSALDIPSSTTDKMALLDAMEAEAERKRQKEREKEKAMMKPPAAPKNEKKRKLDELGPNSTEPPKKKKKKKEKVEKPPKEPKPPKPPKEPKPPKPPKVKQPKAPGKSKSKKKKTKAAQPPSEGGSMPSATNVSASAAEEDMDVDIGDADNNVANPSAAPGYPTSAPAEDAVASVVSTSNRPVRMRRKTKKFSFSSSSSDDDLDDLDELPEKKKKKRARVQRRAVVVAPVTPSIAAGTLPATGEAAAAAVTTEGEVAGVQDSSHVAAPKVDQDDEHDDLADSLSSDDDNDSENEEEEENDDNEDKEEDNEQDEEDDEADEDGEEEDEEEEDEGGEAQEEAVPPKEQQTQPETDAPIVQVDENAAADTPNLEGAAMAPEPVERADENPTISQTEQAEQVIQQEPQSEPAPVEVEPVEPEAAPSETVEPVTAPNEQTQQQQVAAEMESAPEPESAASRARMDISSLISM